MGDYFKEHFHVNVNGCNGEYKFVRGINSLTSTKILSQTAGIVMWKCCQDETTGRLNSLQPLKIVVHFDLFRFY